MWSREARPGNGRPPVQDCRRGGLRPTLNPARGQHRWGSDPSLCADDAHQFGSNLETRSWPQGVDRGAGLSKRRPALGLLRVNLESGTAGSNPAAPADHAGQPSNGKSLQWIERLKGSTYPNSTGALRTTTPCEG